MCSNSFPKSVAHSNFQCAVTEKSISEVSDFLKGIFEKNQKVFTLIAKIFLYKKTVECA